MWEAIVAGALALLGVVLGQQMSRDAAQESHYLQLEEGRRLEVRRLLVRLIVDARALVSNARFLLPAFTKFETSDFTEFVETDTGREMGARSKRLEEDLTALALLVPDGPLRAALNRLEVAAVRDWSEKAMGPVTGNRPPEDGRDRLEAAFAHVHECQRALNDVQREAGLYLAVLPGRRPSLAARVRARRTRSRA